MFLIGTSPRLTHVLLHPAERSSRWGSWRTTLAGETRCEALVGIQTGWTRSTQTPAATPALLRGRVAFGTRVPPIGGSCKCCVNCYPQRCGRGSASALHPSHINVWRRAGACGRATRGTICSGERTRASARRGGRRVRERTGQRRAFARGARSAPTDRVCSCSCSDDSARTGCLCPLAGMQGPPNVPCVSGWWGAGQRKRTCRGIFQISFTCACVCARTHTCTHTHRYMHTLTELTRAHTQLGQDVSRHQADGAVHRAGGHGKV